MCALNDPTTLAEMKAKTSRIKAWKILLFPSGLPTTICLPKNQRYKPGCNDAFMWSVFENSYIEVPPDHHYDSQSAGIHAYLPPIKEMAERYTVKDICKSISVEIEPEDVVACESECYSDGESKTLRQIVARKIWINPQEWTEKGFEE